MELFVVDKEERQYVITSTVDIDGTERPVNTGSEPIDTLSSSICTWDNIDHGTSLWGKIIQFIHNIFYLIKNLFK